MNNIKTLERIVILFVCFFLPLQGHARAFSCCAHNFETYGFLQEIDNHILSLREKNLGRAYYQHTSKMFRKETSFQEFQRIINKYPPLCDNLAIRLQTIEFSDEIGLYRGTLTAVDGAELGIEFRLLKEEKGWKILGFQLYDPLCQKKTPTG